MKLFTKTITIQNVLSQKELSDYIEQRDREILEKYKDHKSPTEICRAMDNRVTRWVVVRVLTRAGLWDKYAKQVLIQKRCQHVDYNGPAYYDVSKMFKNETLFQEHISEFLKTKNVEFVAEVQLKKMTTNARADFVGKDFVIEAKNTVKHDDLCRGLGQCVTYRSIYPQSKIALVYPDDLEPTGFMNKCFVDSGFSLLPFSHLEKWLP